MHVLTEVWKCVVVKDWIFVNSTPGIFNWTLHLFHAKSKKLWALKWMNTPFSLFSKVHLSNRQSFPLLASESIFNNEKCYFRKNTCFKRCDVRKVWAPSTFSLSRLSNVLQEWWKTSDLVSVLKTTKLFRLPMKNLVFTPIKLYSKAGNTPMQVISFESVPFHLKHNNHYHNFITKFSL